MGDSGIPPWTAPAPDRAASPSETNESGTQRIIAAGFAFMLLLMVMLTGLAISRLAEMKQRMVDLVSEGGVKLESVYQMRSLSRERFASLGQIVVLDDPFERDDEAMRFRGQANDFVAARDRLLAFPMSAEERTVWERARQLVQRDQQLHDEVLDLALSEQRTAAMALLTGEVRATEVALLAAFDQLVAQYHAANAASLREAESDFREAEISMLVLLGLVLVLSLAIAWGVIGRARKAEVALVREHGAAVAAAEQLSWAASHDSLTGLANRREMRRRLAELVQGAQLRAESHVLLYIDLDRFKPINDRYGHLAGDAALRQVAEIFLHQVRSGDLVARVGGDEFCIGLANCDAIKGRQIAEAIRDAVQQHGFSWEAEQFELGASIGLVQLQAVPDVDQALKAADAACYRAKAAGRDQVRAYGEYAA